ncbi:aminotransferase class I/II-fold pyridoxal phosphate-dependent enzyme [Legionella jordanis]|nr:aminotransferase class I/II-fold pyridoxal phosphate-dependent enzyme [Legionella jordanis]
MDTLLHQFCQELKDRGLYRARFIRSHDTLLNFSSNDYLSLSNEPLVKQAFQRGFKKYSAGSGGSMVVCGNHPMHKELEHNFAQELNADDAILFTSGYAANLAVVSLLARLKIKLCIDKGIHASIYDGIKLHKAEFKRFLHNNLASLDEQLNLINSPGTVVTEGIFSMSGEVAELSAMHLICKKSNAELIVDEAHAFGVLGHKGLGAVEHHGLTQQEVALRIIPFGKSLACQSAIVVGRKPWIEALLQAARSHIYSTAISPALSYGLLETFYIVLAADERRKKLYELVEHFRQAIKNSPLKWRHSSTAIQQLQLGCPHKALTYGAKLREKGIFCSPMREPTVTRKETGLRIILNYHHEPKDINFLFSQLHDIYATEH